MNVVLDSLLHPLAFDNYLCLSFLSPLHNFWTWLALLTGTAALSFWKIRASASASAASPKPQLPSPPSPPPSTFPISDAASPSHTLCQPPLKSFTPTFNVDDGVTRGKFTAYYICDDFDSHSQCATEEEETSSPPPPPSSSPSDEWWESWDKLLRMRLGESKSSWNMHLDLTELNGNVVRLWDPPSVIPSLAVESTLAFPSSRSVLR